MDLSSLRLENDRLALSLDPVDLSYEVLHKQTGVRWQMAGAYHNDVTLQNAAGKRTDHSLSEFKDSFDIWSRADGLLIRIPPAGLSIRIALDNEDVIVETAPDIGGSSKPRDLLYPRHFVLPVSSGNYATFPMSQGSIIPADWPARFHHPEGYSEQAMTYHGSYIKDGDCGFIAIAETSDDLYLAVWHDENAAAGTFIHWLPSLGSLSYARRVRYTFAKGLVYQKQALIYRDYAKRNGFYASLREKLSRNPNIGKLLGGCVLNCFGAMRNFRNFTYRFVPFNTSAQRVEAFRKLTGIENAVVHLDGWGKYGYDNLHPDYLPPNGDCGGARGLKNFSERTKALGYLFGLHDQYIDNYMDSPSFMDENFQHREDGRPVKVNNWWGGMAFHNCYTASLRFVKRNIFEGVKDLYLYHKSPSVMDICDPTAYYLDCFTRTVECFHPAHPQTRKQNRETQREILRTVQTGNFGQTHPIVLQCEHVRDFAIPEVDFSYGLGAFVADVEVVGGGSETQSIGINVPLWHLAFHDAVVLPHSNDQESNILYGCPPWFSLNEETWETDVRKSLPMKKLVMKLHSEIGLEPMTGHQLLESDGSVEKTEFGGVSVLLNRKEKTVRIEGGKADTGGEIKYDSLGG
ncbi:MAG: DUF5696 domain-containing protein [Planctomycetota bacterium]